MRKLIMVGVMAIAVASMVGCERDKTKEQEAQAATLDRANASTPIPTLDYFQERRTIAEWAKRWDKPNLPCYVYLVSYGKIIGYYVTNGKPASTRSYLLPELKSGWVGRHANGQWEQVESADLDGTYGTNNPGIRFFTAEGTAVEWAGDGAAYIYSDNPLPLDVPKLNRQ